MHTEPTAAQVHPQFEECAAQMVTNVNRQFDMAGANRSPLKGIKEHENEDLSEVTPYRPSNVFMESEPQMNQAMNFYPQQQHELQ